MKLFKIQHVRKGFFLDPKLRISQRSTLNDPFECLPKANQVADLYDRIFSSFKNDGHDVQGNDRIGAHIRNSNADILYRYTSLYNHYGIVSFCQEINSVVMWSHYANNHRGIAIEIDIEKMGLKNAIQHSKFHGEDKTKPQQIIYSKSRGVSDLGQNSFNHLFDSFFIKSDKWAYEKEYRIVADLSESNEVLVDSILWEELVSKNIEYKKFFEPSKRADQYVELKLNSSAYEVDETMTFGDNPDKMRRNLLTNTYMDLAKYPSTLFLFKIPIESISKIYLGCSINHSDKESILEEVRQNFHRPEVVQLERHRDRFELIKL